MLESGERGGLFGWSDRRLRSVGWAAVASVLFVYLVGTSTEFDVANVLLCVPMALPAWRARVYPSVAISLAFGVIGAAHLLGFEV